MISWSRVRFLFLLFCCGPWEVPGAFAQVKLLAEHSAERPPGLDRKWPAVVNHTHNWRFREGEAAGSFSAAEAQLVRWCRELGIRAVGVGSAWNPANEAYFKRFEGPDRDLYYSGKFNQKSVMDVSGVNANLAELNAQARGSTLFYLDNETPKNRMGHMWWFGYLYDYPAWHDYSQDRPIKYYKNDPAVEINALTGEPHTRRNLFEVMAVQHKAGAVGVFAHPTRWWVSDGKFTSNIAAMAGLFLIVNGSLDGLAVMGDRVYNKPYQDMWFSLLDTGGKVPGFAETDFFLNQVSEHNTVDTFRNYPHIGKRPLSELSIRNAARSGEVFLSNGGFLNVSVDGSRMGSVVRTSPIKRHRLRIEVYPAPGTQLGRIEIIGKHGTVLAKNDRFSGGILEYEIPGSGEPDYVVVRAFGSGDDPEHNPEKVRHLAISNPIYLWPAAFHPKVARTACSLNIESDSRWIGGSLEFQTGDGARIRRVPIRAGTISLSVAADARVVLSKKGVRTRMFYIAMENEEVEKNISYLSSGEFRKDYPGIPQGVVPPKAFRLDSMRHALERFDYVIR